MNGIVQNQSQTQKLTMSTQLQQAIKLLELNAQELHQHIALQVLENPVLDIEMDDLRPLETPAAAEDDNLWGGDMATSSNDDGTAGLVDTNLSLRDHITRQINADFTDIKERFIASYLVEQIDDAGYLRIDLAEVALKLGVEVTMVEAIKQRLQQMDPAGLFAANLQECLALQLKDQGEYQSPVKDFIEHMDMFAAGKIDALMRVCGISKSDLPAIVGRIRRLNPKPGHVFGHQHTQAIIPDVILSKDKDGGWLISVNPASLPKVLVNNEYMASLGSDDKATSSYVNGKLREAKFLIKALDQRARTILRVGKEIVTQQRNFFDHGLNYLKPLVLREVADVLELHESTISRVTNKKYMQTPMGVFELKYFFSSTLKGNAGREEFSAQSVKGMIAEIIKAEDAQNPYSDDELVAQLSQKGVEVARRTVAKYRESQGIATSYQRKRDKMIGLS